MIHRLLPVRQFWLSTFVYCIKYYYNYKIIPDSYEVVKLYLT